MKDEVGIAGGGVDDELDCGRLVLHLQLRGGHDQRGARLGVG
jgi:hypothetical protein